MPISNAVRRVSLISLLVALLAAAPAQAYRYAALGDSYSSGAGVGGSLDSCGRSALAYPMLVGSKWALGTTQFLACNGATAASVQTQAAQVLPTTDFVTITAGGNDIGFSPLVGSCMRSAAMCAVATTIAESMARYTLPARLDALYAAVTKQAPSATILVLNYPRLVAGTCTATGALTAAGVQQLNGVVDTLRTTISGRARAAGPRFRFIDVVPRFSGHELCSTTVPWIREDFHPNSVGQRDGYFAAISAALGS